MVGGLWALAAWLLGRIDCPAPVQALVLAAVPWLTTGFLHLDGYMDVCDAVLSRRDLATRQKILKDSHCGAFAVIALGLLFLAQWSVFFTAGTVALLPLGMIPVATRACAGGISAAYGDQSVCQLGPEGQSWQASGAGGDDFAGCGIAHHPAGWSGLCSAGRRCGVWIGGLVRISSAGWDVRRYFWLCPHPGGAGWRSSFDVGEVSVWI